MTGDVKTEREQAFYKEMFIQLLDIVDAITGQMFERISVIPYPIRQFCKCIYQMSIEKFGPERVPYERGIKIVAHYLLEEWLLKACFENLHIEGLTKEFYLGAYCKKNLALTMNILYSIMTFQEWEVPTPAHERIFTKENLFSMDPEKKLKQRNHVETYYRDLLQLDAQKNAKNVLQVDSFVQSEGNKFPWRMMLISMDDVRVLLEFFKDHVVNIKRGAKVLLERIEDYEGLTVGEPDDAAVI